MRLDYFKLFSATLLLLLLARTTFAAKVQSRIVGGKQTTISSVPYLVQVLRSDGLCGGSLIAANWVLTAAHCTNGYSASAFLVIAGTSELEGANGERRLVTFKATPKKFSTRSMNMDCTLLKLKTPFTLNSNIAVIKMASKGPGVGGSVRIAGWGLTSEGGSVSTMVRSTQVKVKNRKSCARQYRGRISITANMFCAAGGGAKDSCSGDSGGGVVANNILVGVVSFGVGCARSGYPGVYTKVARVRSWINKVMANNK